jgi:septum formation protein
VNPFWPLAEPLHLASRSPRRRALLAELGIPFVVLEPGVEEEPSAGSSPAEHAVSLALAKAQEVAGRVPRGLVLGADTVVLVDGRILGKPEDNGDAARMLRALAGRTHEVLTGLALLRRPDGRTLTGVSRTLVRMRALSEAEIQGYVATGEPHDKAGAYGIQGFASAVVERVDGCWFNVVGLPVALLGDLVRRMDGA